MKYLDDKIRNVLLVLVVLSWSAVSWAQVSYNPVYSGGTTHRFAVGVNMLYYYGDVYPSRKHPLAVPTRGENFCVGFNGDYIYQVLPELGLRTTLMVGGLRGDTMDSSLIDVAHKGTFCSIFFEPDFGVEWYPIPHREGGLFLYAGVGLHMSAIHCDFDNAARNPGDNGEPGWRMGVVPMLIGEIGYSFLLPNGDAISIKGSVHNGFINVNSKNPKVGYNIDGWGRGDLNKADFAYEKPNNSNDKYGETALGQFTDGYFTFGVAYTFNNVQGKEIKKSSSKKFGRDKTVSTSKTPTPMSTRNPRAEKYHEKVSKKRTKAFFVGSSKTKKR